MTVHTTLTSFADGPESPFVTELETADWVTAVSQSVANDIVGLAPSLSSRLSVIPNGVAFAEPLTPPPDIPRLVCVGRLVEGKRVDLVIEATDRLATRHPEVRLTIAGIGPCEASLREQVARLGIADRVEFLGLVPRERVADLLCSASIVVMPSEVEGLPLAALEAAWMGRPVVGTTSTGLVDAVIDGETGRLVERGDIDGLTDALDDLLAHPDRVKAFGMAARARAEREFSLEVCASRYEALYERAIAQDDVSERV